MTKHQKILTTVAWALLVVLMVGIVVSRQRDRDMVVTDVGSEPAKIEIVAPSFALIDQNEKKFGSEDLKGKVWIAQLIFTNCAGPCPMMLGKMKQLQQSVPDPNVHLVSFTVDPERDTPNVLKEAADKLGADHARWHFLTGTKEEIDAVAGDMMLAANRPADGPIIHSTHFLLFDAAGKCRGFYNNSDPAAMDELRAKAVALVAERGAQ